jgi:hypothetical protein
MKRGVNPLYIHAFLNSELGQLQLETVTSGGAQGGITRDFAKEIQIPLIEKETQQNIASEWKNGMLQSDTFRKQYEESVDRIKKEVDVMIENARPLSDEELTSILEIVGETEEAENENEIEDK